MGRPLRSLLLRNEIKTRTFSASYENGRYKCTQSLFFANILQTGASLVLVTCFSVFAHLKLPFTVYTSAIILISQSIGKLLFSCVTQLVSNKKVEVIRLKTIQMQINFAFKYSISCKSEIKSTALESESERGKQCFAGFRGGNKCPSPPQPNPTRTRFVGGNFLDGFLHYPWAGEWGRGGGGEESLQKPGKKVTLL